MEDNNNKRIMRGRVKFYDPNRGYGFIIGKNDREYFFHFSEIEGDHKVLVQDEPVEFEPVETGKGLQAQKIVTIKE